MNWVPAGDCGGCGGGGGGPKGDGGGVTGAGGGELGVGIPGGKGGGDGGGGGGDGTGSGGGRGGTGGVGSPGRDGGGETVGCSTMPMRASVMGKHAPGFGSSGLEATHVTYRSMICLGAAYAHEITMNSAPHEAGALRSPNAELDSSGLTLVASGLHRSAAWSNVVVELANTYSCVRAYQSFPTA